MGKWKFVVGVLAVLCTLAAVYLVLGSEYALVTHPEGIIAHSQLKLIKTNIALMLLILVPTLLVTLFVAWKYRAHNSKVERNHRYRGLTSALFWIIPSIVVVIMAVITWEATHELDPYKPLKSDVKPLAIQVIAINWKWLFIYPEQGIATINFVQFPEKTPINFSLAADGSPMNSFWIPQLSGQIYCMTGMVTPLHIMADGTGIYSGKAAEINGSGYASMNFVAKSVSRKDFDAWVQEVKKSPLQLTENVYKELLEPSEDHPVTYYSLVEGDLFNKNVMKYMHP